MPPAPGLGHGQFGGGGGGSKGSPPQFIRSLNTVSFLWVHFVFFVRLDTEHSSSGLRAMIPRSSTDSTFHSRRIHSPNTVNHSRSPCFHGARPTPLVFTVATPYRCILILRQLLIQCGDYLFQPMFVPQTISVWYSVLTVVVDRYRTDSR